MKRYLTICIDDDEEFLVSLRRALPGKVSPLCREFACEFEFVTSADELRQLLAGAAGDGVAPAMIISDQLMPGISGLELIEQVKKDYPDLVCVLLTGHGGLDSAKQAINRRLLDQYVSKPVEDMHEFASSMANLLKRHHLQLEERQRTEQLAETVEKLRLSNEQIRAMHSAAEQIAMLSKGLKCVDLDEVIQLVTHEVPKVFGAEFGVLCLRGPQMESQEPSPTISKFHCPATEQFLISRAEGDLAQQDSPIIAERVPAPCQALGGRAPNVVVPLRVGGFDGSDDKQRWAYMCMCCTTEASPMASRDVLRYKAGLIQEVLGANLTNAVLYKIARLQGEVDSLTGACTRRVLEDKLQAEFERAVRYGHPFCLVVVDIDEFKKINDQFGHAAGDRALRDLADTMRQHSRVTDTLGRYGGDEFVWLLPETGAEAAVAGVSRLRQHIQSQPADGRPPITVSCGVAEWSGSAKDSATEVLRRADAAMYEAKRSGRNRVEVYGKQPICS
ncbi:MAG: diguanylate cyclase [Phycisphaerae bacterium]|nr:diguanylate cyclase [Phycisphaerae bacterium]